MGLLLCSSSYAKLIRNNSDKMKNKLDQQERARANRPLGRDDNLCVDTETGAWGGRVPAGPSATAAQQSRRRRPLAVLPPRPSGTSQGRLRASNRTGSIGHSGQRAH